MIAFLKDKGIAPVDKTPHGGAFWIPGDMSIKPLIKEIENTYNIKIAHAPAPKALKKQPGWYIKADMFFVGA